MKKTENAVRSGFRCAMCTSPISDAVASCTAMFVAFSGGADSAALLTLMREYAAEKSIQERKTIEL